VGTSYYLDGGARRVVRLGRTRAIFIVSIWGARDGVDSRGRGARSGTALGRILRSCGGACPWAMRSRWRLCGHRAGRATADMSEHCLPSIAGEHLV